MHVQNCYFFLSSLVKLPEKASDAAEIEVVVAVIIVFCILHAYYMQLKHIVISA